MIFPRGLLMGMPLEDGKKGFASLALKDRHPHNMCLASLMRDWRGLEVAPIISRAATKTDWTDEKMRELEGAVTIHYTQSFYDYFGRAPVIPMRLEHEFGT
ncbi:hypothetical protein DFH09DRAFT_1327057 [Mycena vulgaris]|nr:hypothetical protein DFH09DRAFT_1327057 [Mycena vulgaris]